MTSRKTRKISKNIKIRLSNQGAPKFKWLKEVKFAGFRKIAISHDKIVEFFQKWMEPID